MFTLDTVSSQVTQLPRYCYEADPSAFAPVVTVVTIADSADIAWDALAQCLRLQSVQHWEWVIVLPPTYTATQALSELVAADSRIRSITADVGAAALTCSRLTQATACEYLCYLDSQSLIEPTFLEKCLWLLGTNPEIAFCNSHSSSRSTPQMIWQYGFEQGSKFLDENYAGETFVIKRSAYAVVAAEQGRAAHGYAGWERWLQLARQGLWGYTIPETLIAYAQIDSRAPFRPADTQQQQAFRRYVQEHYGELKRPFPSSRLAEPRTYEQLVLAPPINNQLVKPVSTTRLLIIMPWLIVGGSERVNLDIIRYLTHSGYEVSFATTLPNISHGWIAEFARYTSDIFVLDRFLRLSDYPRFLVYVIKSRQIDVVMISNSYLGYQLLPYLRAHCPEVTFVDYCHSGADEWKNGGYPRCGAGYQELLDLNITSSQNVKESMIERGADPDRIDICYTNIDVEKWHPDAEARKRKRALLELREDVPLIVFVGRIDGDKRPSFLAQIVRTLQDDIKGQFVCAVLGDGPERPSLEYLVRSLKIDTSMKLLGRVSDSELHDYMAAADIFLLPSAIEGISVAIFEAMAMGLVPVAARVGGQSELVTADCGILIPHGPNELAAYVDALRQLIQQHDQRRHMGMNARDRVERLFPLTALGPRMAELLDKARALHASNPRPLVGQGLAREYAVQVLEYTRLETALDQLWMERESWRSKPRPHPNANIAPATTRRRIARFVRAKGARWYHWGVDHGMDWLIPFKDRAITWAKKRGW
jgi:glycosyltransferase involved in cell wall biosynthesis